MSFLFRLKFQMLLFQLLAWYIQPAPTIHLKQSKVAIKNEHGIYFWRLLSLSSSFCYFTPPPTMAASTKGPTSIPRACVCSRSSDANNFSSSWMQSVSVVWWVAWNLRVANWWDIWVKMGGKTIGNMFASRQFRTHPLHKYAGGKAYQTAMENILLEMYFCWCLLPFQLSIG